ncbi:MAG: TauD/TfdA family dioxygenase [Nitrospira sp.]|nr:TauD/TfdA family dioxygenase [Nitrospira sp.]
MSTSSGHPWKVDINKQGWAVLQGITTTAEMQRFAESLGSVLRAPSGEVVKVLKPRVAHESPRCSLSGRYGNDGFPFHTDTAFWALPCRFIVMRVVGDTRRNTLLLDFDALWAGFDSVARHDAVTSIWRTPRETGGIYCSLRFSVGGSQGWRYDADIMRPVNQAAVRTKYVLEAALRAPTTAVPVKWAETDCLVVDNWRCLHARSARPDQEQERNLFRIYVR